MPSRSATAEMAASACRCATGSQLARSQSKELGRGRERHKAKAYVEIERSPAERLSGVLFPLLEPFLLQTLRITRPIRTLRSAPHRRQDVQQPTLEGRAIEGFKGGDGVGRLDKRDVRETFCLVRLGVDRDVDLVDRTKRRAQLAQFVRSGRERQIPQEQPTRLEQGFLRPRPRRVLLFGSRVDLFRSGVSLFCWRWRARK